MLNTALSDIMRDFRQYTSRGIKKLLFEENKIHFLRIFEKAALTSPKQQYRVWQEDYHPVALKTEKWFNEKMLYLHANPVRKGFVELPEHWKYSSARNWLHNDDSIISIDRGVLLGEG
jgi:hypothetical protein